MPKKPEKTVFVLGAGASKASDFKLPVMKGFLANVRKHDPREAHLYQYLKATLPSVPLSRLNLEEVFTQIELDLCGFASIKGLPQEILVTAKRQLLDYVRRRLDIRKNGAVPICRMHQRFLNHILSRKPCATILTLNYDLVVDVTLHDDGTEDRGILWLSYGLLDRNLSVDFERPTLSPTEEGFGYYLKLHGSLDWAFCPNPRCANHQLFFPYRLGYVDPPYCAGDPCKLCGTSLEWVIVPPTMQKSFETFPKLGLVWRLAHEELKKATKVVFWGVSLAASDYYLHWLIRSSLVYRDPKPKVVVINKRKAVLRQTNRLTGTSARFFRSMDDCFDKAGG